VAELCCLIKAQVSAVQWPTTPGRIDTEAGLAVPATGAIRWNADEPET
jgi:hypothetical protein